MSVDCSMCALASIPLWLFQNYKVTEPRDLFIPRDVQVLFNCGTRNNFGSIYLMSIPYRERFAFCLKKWRKKSLYGKG